MGMRKGTWGQKSAGRHQGLKEHPKMRPAALHGARSDVHGYESWPTRPAPGKIALLLI